MSNIPLHIALILLFVVFSCLLVAIGIFKRSSMSPVGNIWTKRFIIGSVALLGLHGLLTNFSSNEDAAQSGMFYCLYYGSCLIFISIFLFAKKSKEMTIKASIKHLTIVQIFRAPVDLLVLWLISKSLLPEHFLEPIPYFGLIFGLTAPIIWWIRKSKVRFNRRFIYAWNFMGLIFLLRWIINSITLLPNHGEFLQSNWMPFHFPMTWITGYLASVFFLAHAISIRNLWLFNLTKNEEN
ncbi:MAG: hypothetical protein ACJAY8_000748 [Sphingobacteriales bacterium]|jgi:hypothetical protein